MILRPGYINRKMLEELIGPVELDPTLLGATVTGRPKAPGMKYRHYAPKADMVIVEGSRERVISYINDRIRQELEKGGMPGVIASSETEAEYIGGIVESVGSRSDELSISRHLYGVLRDFDRQKVSCIFSEAFDTPNLGQAIMNRLVKAAGHQIVKV